MCTRPMFSFYNACVLKAKQQHNKQRRQGPLTCAAPGSVSGVPLSYSLTQVAAPRRCIHTHETGALRTGVARPTPSVGGAGDDDTADDIAQQQMCKRARAHTHVCACALCASES